MTLGSKRRLTVRTASTDWEKIVFCLFVNKKFFEGKKYILNSI